MLLRCKRGFSILELVVVLTIVGVLWGVLGVDIRMRIQRAQVKKTVTEMTALAQAVVNYKEAKGICPVNLSSLAPVYIGMTPKDNPFGQGYDLSCMNSMVTIFSNVPAGAAKVSSLGSLFEVVPGENFDTLKVTQRTPVGAAGRLLYDKRYLYGG